MTKLKRKDLIYIGVTLILFAALFIKSTIMDVFKTEDPQMIEVVEKLEVIIEDAHTGFFYESGIITIRIVNAKIEGVGFKGQYRKYLLGIFPMGDIYFSSQGQ